LFTLLLFVLLGGLLSIQREVLDALQAVFFVEVPSLLMMDLAHDSLLLMMDWHGTHHHGSRGAKRVRPKHVVLVPDRGFFKLFMPKRAD